MQYYCARFTMTFGKFFCKKNDITKDLQATACSLHPNLPTANFCKPNVNPLNPIYLKLLISFNNHDRIPKRSD